jgi:deoxyribodipyrimidine photolyase-related protein
MGGKASVKPPQRCRRLVLVLGDQLDRKSAALEGFDPGADRIFMAEVRAESTHVWSHQARTALFLSAMRHFARDMRELGYTVDYIPLDAHDNLHTLEGELKRAIGRHQPSELVFVEPGDFRVREELFSAARATGTPCSELVDTHFLCTRDEFKKHAQGRKQLRMEFFYRPMREKHQLLMDGKQPAGGAWNFDAENRSSFGREGPGWLPKPVTFAPDAITREVIELVGKTFESHPGQTDAFDWPVTPDQAEQALDDFIRNRLPWFGAYQDAIWEGEPWLYHSRLSAALNLKLISPLRVCRRAEEAWREGLAPLAATEGFIRQILGWREYVRGIYWLHMPGYLQRNALNATHPLPAFYWTGQTEMACLRDAINQTLRLGYAHHIQRLMVTGLFALLLGVDPQAVHAWYLAVYVDAVEWVELPNTLGMSQYADGGIMASKPYVATGKYIQRMSNHCGNCRYKPDASTGETACPFTTLYWDFLDRHQELLAKNPRMSLQVKNLSRLTNDQRKEISQQARRIRLKLASETL